MPKFKLLVDGQEVVIPEALTDVKLIVEDFDEDEPEVQLHFMVNHEGTVQDTILADGTVRDSSSHLFTDYLWRQID